ncbi:hypothetical protein UT300012_40120 [Paraclostridium bifermentans]
MEAKNQESKKICFIITPIGSESDPIRRHIDGIIDAVIEPVLLDKEYTSIVAHRISLTGSINKQVINGIYNADLIIANLTELNPNVMYELAFAHSIGKPTITIAEDGKGRLPFDISTERTIFYKNDFKGSLELKENLIEMIDCLDGNTVIDNPIYSWLDASIYEKTLVRTLEQKEAEISINESDLFKYIVNRLDRMESKISNNINTNIKEPRVININGRKDDINRINVTVCSDGEDMDYIYKSLTEALGNHCENIKIASIIPKAGNRVSINFNILKISKHNAKRIIEKAIEVIFDEYYIFDELVTV